MTTINNEILTTFIDFINTAINNYLTDVLQNIAEVCQKSKSEYRYETRLQCWRLTPKTSNISSKNLLPGLRILEKRNTNSSSINRSLKKLKDVNDLIQINPF